MRTDFTANFAAKIAAATSTPLLLIEITFNDASVVYLSDTPVTVGGQAYTPLVVSWGEEVPFPGTIFGPLGREIGTVEQDGSVKNGLVLSNIAYAHDGDTTPFSTYLTTKVFENSTARVYLWFETTDAADKTLLEIYNIDGIEYDEMLFKMRLASPLRKANKPIGRKLLTADYPNADPDVIGFPLNIVYGDCKNVFCHPVDAGAASTLCTDGGIDETQTTNIKITQGQNDTVFPSSGDIYIDDEKLHYTGRTVGVGLITLTGVTRGYDTTTATPHGYGSAVYEVQTSYIYMVADHAVDQILTVFVDGIAQVGGYLAFTGQIGDSHPSGLYNGKAVLDFEAKPTINQQVNINIVDGISVNDGIGVNDPGHVHGIGYRSTPVYGTSGVDSKPSGWTTSGVFDNIYDGVEDSDGDYYYVEDASATQTGNVRVGFPAWNGPTPTEVKLCCRYKWYMSDAIDASHYLKLGTSAGNGTVLGIDSTAFHTSKISNGTTYPTDVYLSFSNTTGTYYVYIVEVWLEVTTDSTASAAAGVTKTGSATKSGTVSLDSTNNATANLVIGNRITCNVEGETFSGELTQEDPTDVIKDFCETYGGLTCNAADFAAAWLLTRAKSYKFCGVIRDYSDFVEILARMSLQCRCAVWYTRGEVRIKMVPDSPTSAKAIPQNQIASIRVSKTPLNQAINTVYLHYNYDWSTLANNPSNFLSSIYDANSASVTNYNTREVPRLFLCDFINDATTATSIRDFFIAKYKDVKKRVPATIPIKYLDLEQYDYIDLTHTGVALTSADVLCLDMPPLHMPGGVDTEMTQARAWNRDYQPSARPPLISLNAREV